jgi:hypothetical protein
VSKDSRTISSGQAVLGDSRQAHAPDEDRGRAAQCGATKKGAVTVAVRGSLDPIGALAAVLGATSFQATVDRTTLRLDISRPTRDSRARIFKERR